MTKSCRIEAVETARHGEFSTAPRRWRAAGKRATVDVVPDLVHRFSGSGVSAISSASSRCRAVASTPRFPATGSVVSSTWSPIRRRLFVSCGARPAASSPISREDRTNPRCHAVHSVPGALSDVEALVQWSQREDTGRRAGHEPSPAARR